MSRRRAKSPPFVMIPRYVTRSPAWRSLNGDCRALYLELRERFNGHNNGSIGLGNREAGEAINTGKDTARRCFDILIERGFIAVGSNSTFNQKRLSREWRLTELPDDRTGHKASKEFMSWAGQKQNIGAPTRRIGASMRHETANSEQISGHRRTHAPVTPVPETLQAHPCATYRYTTPPAAELALAGEQASPHKAGARRTRQAGAPTVTLSPSLVANLAKKMRVAT